jgi:hypothetical protein
MHLLPTNVCMLINHFALLLSSDAVPIDCDLARCLTRCEEIWSFAT